MTFVNIRKKYLNKVGDEMVVWDFALFFEVWHVKLVIPNLFMIAKAMILLHVLLDKARDSEFSYHYWVYLVGYWNIWSTEYRRRESDRTYSKPYLTELTPSQYYWKYQWKGVAMTV